MALFPTIRNIGVTRIPSTPKLNLSNFKLPANFKINLPATSTIKTAAPAVVKTSSVSNSVQKVGATVSNSPTRKPKTTSKYSFADTTSSFLAEYRVRKLFKDRYDYAAPLALVKREAGMWTKRKNAYDAFINFYDNNWPGTHSKDSGSASTATGPTPIVKPVIKPIVSAPKPSLPKPTPKPIVSAPRPSLPKPTPKPIVITPRPSLPKPTPKPTVSSAPILPKIDLKPGSLIPPGGWKIAPIPGLDISKNMPIKIAEPEKAKQYGVFDHQASAFCKTGDCSGEGAKKAWTEAAAKNQPAVVTPPSVNDEAATEEFDAEAYLAEQQAMLDASKLEPQTAGSGMGQKVLIGLVAGGILLAFLKGDNKKKPNQALNGTKKAGKKRTSNITL